MTDALEIYIIEIEKAKQILEEISENEHERCLTELREKYILDQKDIEAYGYEKGYESRH